MDRTKTKTFIAFINNSGKDRYWIDGNCTFEQDRPTILPYETQEQIDSATNFARTMGIWDEVTDVYGIILKVAGSPFEIINRKEADVIAKEYKDKEMQRKLDAGVFKPQEKKKRGKKDQEKVEVTPVEVKPAEVKKEIVVKVKKDSNKDEKPKRAKFIIEE